MGRILNTIKGAIGIVFDVLPYIIIFALLVITIKNFLKVKGERKKDDKKMGFEGFCVGCTYTGMDLFNIFTKGAGLLFKGFVKMSERQAKIQKEKGLKEKGIVGGKNENDERDWTGDWSKKR